ncbi:hypothetical protein D3C73_1536210 [compost metagenome]
MTYHVGWKKGKIQVRGTASEPNAEASAAQPVSVRDKILMAAWKEAPYPGLREASVMLMLLPAVAFAAILWLVSQLSGG